MTTQEKPLLIPDGSEVTKINAKEYNANVINSIAKKYPVERQDSKAP